ncbi:MAG: site-2 protease family protein [Firmicutes bacterium]|nr:site-2 protease family protein [[Eubacterium] siraeum]MCM1489140.1 site-2 protease family protein [Bacillota bacterium]
MTIVLAILAFCIIIIIHEMGHFFAAKACGIRVSEFSLGMGPTILKKQGKETLYTVKLFPIGGSVQLGEDEESDDPRSFRNKPVWQRMIVLAAGPFMNLILGIVVCIIVNLVSGKVITSEIARFVGENPISNQALQENDIITEINGHTIWSSMDISYALQNKAMKASEDAETIQYSFKVKRNGEIITLDNVTFAISRDENENSSVALDFAVYSQKLNFGNVMEYSFKEAATYGRLVWISLMDLISGTYGLNDLAGPVGTVTAISQSATASQDIRVNVINLLSIVALITINLGVFNLLPIPALDGSRIVFLIIELIRRKPMKPEHEGIVHFIGFAALMVLMLFVTFNDIVKLVTGG